MQVNIQTRVSQITISRYDNVAFTYDYLEITMKNHTAIPLNGRHFDILCAIDDNHETTYSMSGKNKLCKCSDKQVCHPRHHDQPIYEIDECKQAAVSIGEQFIDSRRRIGFPKGCYFFPGNGIYFNIHAVGRESRIAEQVCKFEPPKGK